MMILYLVYEYEYTYERIEGHKEEQKINQGPIIIGLFSEIPNKFKNHKMTKVETNDSVNDLYVLFRFSLVYRSKLEIIGVYSDLIEMDTSKLEQGCYSIFKIKINDIYPYGKNSICWTNKFLLFQNLFISDNLRALQRLENMIKSGNPIGGHEMVYLENK